MCFFTQNIGRSFDNLGCLREWISSTKEEDDEAAQILEPDWARFGEEWAQEIFERECAGEHEAESEICLSDATHGVSILQLDRYKNPAEAGFLSY